jgi:hypothetical protein
MSLTPELRKARAQKAARTRWHGDSATTTPEMAKLEAEMIDKDIAAVVAAAPKMTREQAERLRAILAPLVAAGRAENQSGRV